MERLISQRTRDEFSILIRTIWLATSDFPISDEDANLRAEVWYKILGEDFFVKYGKYVDYLLKQCCRDRSFRGAIHADEFYRMFCRVVIEKQVYSFRKREWIAEDEAIESILNSNESLGDAYRQVVDTTVSNGRVLDSRLRDQIFDQCRAIIYGWEE